MAGTIKIGDRVRSFDFPDNLVSRDPDDGENACFVEGLVEAITDPETHPLFHDCARYAIRVERRVFAGKPRTGEGSLEGELAYPPVNGIPSWLGGKLTDGVELVTEVEA